MNIDNFSRQNLTECNTSKSIYKNQKIFFLCVELNKFDQTQAKSIIQLG